MNVTLLVMHRKEQYPGQLLPEILAVCDETVFEENPAWWTAEVAKHRELIGNDAAAWAEVSIDIDEQTLLTALYPARTPLQSVVTKAAHLAGMTDPRHQPLVQDPRIGIGSTVVDALADDPQDDDYGFVTEIVDGGYLVVWGEGPVARFADPTEVNWVAPSQAPVSFTRL